MLPVLALLALVAQAAPPPPDTVPLPPGAAEGAHIELLKYRDRVGKDGSQVRTFDIRVRLGTAQGVAEFGQIGQPYVDGFGDVQFEDVTIDKADGKRVEVKNGIVEDVNPLGVSDTSLPADVRFRKLTIPGLEPGDDLSYRIIASQKALAPGRVFGGMKVPAVPGGVSQTYELDLPSGSGIRVRLRDGLGASWEEVPSTPDRHVRRITLRVEPPANLKDLTKTELQKWNEPDVMFTNFSSWAEVSDWWWELSKDRLKPDTAVARQASELVGSARTPREKLAALYAFVATRIRYINVSFGLGRMEPRAAADVLQNKYGDCKGKHALLAALAASLDLDVRPVLISSTLADLRDEAPGPQQFDHMISVARLGPSPADWLWLDGTNPYGGPGYLAPQLRDKRALLIEAGGKGQLVRTPKDPPFEPRQEVTLKGTLGADGVLRARVSWVLRADEEVQFRALLSMVTQERRIAAVKAAIAGDWEVAKVENVLVSDPLDGAVPLRIEFDAQKEVSGQKADRGLWVPLPEFSLPEIPGQVPRGEPAMTFAFRDISARAEILIPEAAQARTPLSVSLERPFGTFRSTYSVEGRTLRLVRTLSLSRPTLAEADAAGYESFRAAVAKDRKQEFTIEGVATAATAPMAESLQKEGLAAFDKKDYAHAAALLQKAADADPKREDVFQDLGRVLDAAGRREEAVAAFTRQIEVAPFHESAYAWRAYSLIRLNRWIEAEKDLLKQIEVAPFKVWSYENLGERYVAEGRIAEAADFYARAAAVEPKEAKRWLTLGVTQAAAARPAEARRSLDKSMSLDPADWMQVDAAAALQSLGDEARAGELAQAALPSLRRRLSALQAGHFGDGDLYWVDELAEAWALMGKAAVTAGDLARAERYLEPAWRVAFSSRGGWALGDLREKQGRLADAVELWSMAASEPKASRELPADRQARIEAACRKLPASGLLASTLPPGMPSAAAKPPRQEIAERRLTQLRTVLLKGPVLADMTEEVLLLADADGRVEHLSRLSPGESKTFDRQIAKLEPVRLPWSRPDEEPFKVVRRGILTCYSATGCALILDLPGMTALTEARAASRTQGASLAPAPGSIWIVSLEPKDGADVLRGEKVTLTAKVRYESHVESGKVSLVVQDQANASLANPAAVPVTIGSGELTLTGTFTVPADASRIDVFVPLFSATGGSTSAVAGAHYVVKPR